MLNLALESMIQQQLVRRGIREPNVITAFRSVPRKIFVPEYLEHQAYADEVLPIGCGQTISAPYTVGRMLQELQLTKNSRVLEVGTGSGFQTALLSTLAKAVYAVEVIPELSARARKVLADDLGIRNVHFRVGDGFQGWSDEAPFDGIIVNCASDDIPRPLIGQLRVGGRLVMPIGDPKEPQVLKVVERTESDVEIRELEPDVFSATFGWMESPHLEN